MGWQARWPRAAVAMVVVASMLACSGGVTEPCAGLRVCYHHTQYATARGLEWFWDGRFCHPAPGLRCTGRDCGDTFRTRQECETAYASCLSRPTIESSDTGSPAVRSWFCDGRDP